MTHINMDDEQIPVITVNASEIPALKHLYFWMFKSEDDKKWCIPEKLCKNLVEAEDNAPLYYKDRKLMKIDILI